MPWEPGQSGNPAGPPKRTKLWREAIQRAVKRREQDDPQALEKLADKLLQAVDSGDVSAMKEFGDRFDGKVPQGVIGGDEGDNPVNVLHRIERVIVDPQSPDSEGVQAPA